MRILIVLAHPKPDSFNAALCGALCAGLAEAGHQTDIADLYAEGFDPVLRGPELDTLGTGHPLSDVAVYQNRILQAQALAFVFPVWWFGVPAILKGFVDRVFQEEFAFRFTSDRGVRGLLHHEKALVIRTAGASASFYRLFRFGRPLEKTFDEWTLRTCGVRTVRNVFFHDVLNVSDAARLRYLERVRRLGRDYF
ncbi:MAG: NAD(P)H-dependent oxidoreductase [Acidobacteriia bacterium]|nr:NAD(P)H-dependent oxidoreductase [Terriglobia bacterium]